MSKYKELFLNIGLFALNTVSTKIITFLLVPLYTYYLDKTQYGITDMAITVIGLVTPLATLSIADSTLRYALDDSQNADAYIVIGLRITILSCILVLLMSPVLNLEIFGGLGQYKLLFILSYTVSSFQQFFGEVSRAINQVKVIPVASIIGSLSTAFLAYIFLAKIRLSINGYFYSVIIGGILAILVYIICGKYAKYIKKMVTYRVHVDKISLMIRYSLPLIPNALFWWIGTSVNRFFITAMMSIAASGLFAAATKIPTMLNIVCGIFQQAWTLSAFKEYKSKNISDFFSKVYKFFRAGMVISASAVIVFASPLARLLLQKEFYSSWTLVPVLLVAFYFNTLNAFYGTIYTASMHTRTIFSTTVVGSMAIIIATVLLVPHFGLFGAAIAMVISNFIVYILRVINSSKWITVEVDYRINIPTMLLLVVQAALVSILGEGARECSIICFTLIVVVETLYLFNDGKRIMSKVLAR